MISELERIAALETKENISQEIVSEIKHTLDSLDEKVGRIEMRFEKSMSFVGGIAFTFSLLGGLFVVVASYVARKLGIIP